MYASIRSAELPTRLGVAGQGYLTNHITIIISIIIMFVCSSSSSSSSSSSRSYVITTITIIIIIIVIITKLEWVAGRGWPWARSGWGRTGRPPRRKQNICIYIYTYIYIYI